MSKIDQAEVLVHAAARLGKDDGHAAGTWVIDGNTSADTMRNMLAMLDSGDPAIYDALPGDPLSGEWADGRTPADVLEHVSYATGLEVHEDDTEGLIDIYEYCWQDAMISEVERVPRLHVEGVL